MREIVKKIWQEIQLMPFLPILLVEIIIIVILFSFKPIEARLTHTDVSYIDSTALYSVLINSERQERDKTYAYEVRVLAMTGEADSLLSPSDNALPPASGRLKLYLRKDSAAAALQIGDVVLMKTTPRRGSILYDEFGSFDYGHYLQLQGIAGTAYADTASWIKVSRLRSRSPLTLAKRWRQRLLTQLSHSRLNQTNRSVVAALTLGYRDDLDLSVKQAFSTAGAMHVLAVSGLHTGIVYAIILLLLTGSWTGRGRWAPLYSQKKRRLIQTLLSLSALWAYALLTSLTPSVVRAATMLSLYEISRLTERQTNRWNIIAASAALALAIRPAALFTVSFQLSYAAVVGLLSVGSDLNRLINRLLALIPFSQGKIGKIERKVVAYPLGLMAVSLSAQLFTLPFTLHYFHQTSNYFMLTNLFVILLATLILVFAIPLLIFASVPYIGPALSFLVDCPTTAMNTIVKWIESLPMASSSFTMSVPEMWCYFVALGAAYLCLKQQRLRFIVPAGIGMLSMCLFHQQNMQQEARRDLIVIQDNLLHLTYRQVDTIKVDGLILFNLYDRRWAVVNSDTLHDKRTESPLHVDYLIIGNSRRTRAEELLALFDADTIISTNAYPAFRRQQMQQQAQEQGFIYITTDQQPKIIQ